jgi:nicotinamide mononucleotide transporter
VSALEWLLQGTIPVGEGALRVPEVLGNVFGLASALLGMRRLVWAWPVGIVGNLLLFTVFVGNDVLDTVEEPLLGQAGRQVFFLAVSVYGWVRWTRSGRHRPPGDSGAITPQWAGRRNLVALAAVAVALYLVLVQVLEVIGSYGPWTEAWILTGSILATYGMARGWVEFWLIWILVDVVGVTTLVQAGFYPTAVMYFVYGLFCLWGFSTWVRAHRRLTATDHRSGDVEVHA